jgi:hypothetical protein
VPIASTLRTGISVFSYCGQVTFGVTGDRDAATDVWTLARGAEQGVADLVTAAGTVGTGELSVGPAPAARGALPGSARAHGGVRTRSRYARRGRQGERQPAARPVAARVETAPAGPPAAEPPAWQLVRDDDGVTAVCPRGQLAAARVHEDGEQVWVEFELDTTPLPARLGTELADSVFEHAALAPRRPFLATIPRAAGEVLAEVCRHAPDARSRVAGATCLVHGRVP